MTADRDRDASPPRRLVPAWVFAVPSDFGRNPNAQPCERVGFPSAKRAAAWTQHVVALRVRDILNDSDRDLSIEKLAGRLNVSSSVLSRKLNGQLAMTLADMSNLAAYLGFDLPQTTAAEDKGSAGPSSGFVQSGRLAELEERIVGLSEKIAALEADLERAATTTRRFRDTACYFQYQFSRYFIGYEGGTLPADDPPVSPDPALMEIVPYLNSKARDKPA